MDWLFANPYVPYVLVAVAVVVVYQALSTRLSVRVPGSSSAADDLIGRILGPRYAAAKIDKAVAREKRQANFLAAGRLYEDAERLPEAADADRKSTRLNSSHIQKSRMPSSA